jgi:hypothetical protein
MVGKDGNPLNEVRMLCDGIMENEGRLSANKGIRYKPEPSVLKFKTGDEIRLNADDFARLSAAFFDEIPRKAGKRRGRTCLSRIKQMPPIPTPLTICGRNGSGKTLSRASGATR